MTKYDETSPKSIEKFAKQLIWKKYWDFLPFEIKIKKDWNKWQLWQLLEVHYFWKELDNKNEPDFPKAWVELKTTSLKQLKKWELVAKERLKLNNINFNELISEKWETSWLIKKISLLLLIFHLYEKESINIDYVIKIVELFSFQESNEDFDIIKNDWHIIQKKIIDWRAHELSEWDTIFLWASPSWATAIKSLKKQPNSNIKAKWRAFAFKQWYMNFILKRFAWEEPNYEKIFTKNKKGRFDFEIELKNLFKPYIWKTAFEIWEQFDLKYTGQKAYYAMLSGKIMWISNRKKIEEFEKANITLKTIRQTPSWSIKENIPFPAFNFSELINETWEESELFNMLETRKFFFVIYKITSKTASEFDKLNASERNKYLILDKVILWNTPAIDIDSKAKLTWKKTIKTLLDWVILTPKLTKKGIITLNNLPVSSETEMIHVRPHALNKDDTDILPDWRELTKQWFWFNKNYIKKELGI